MSNWNKIKKTTLALSIITASLTSYAVNAKQPVWTINNLDQPESVVTSIDGQFIYISNINGQPMELNGQGYISIANANGKMLNQHWLKGLDAPKGLALSGQHLYVADMQKLVKINTSTGKVENTYKAPNAKMLNDVTATTDGTIYVSDLLEGTIYRLKNGKFEAWFKSSALPHPNGLYAQQGELLIGSWGKGMNSDFSTAELGSLLRLNISEQQLSTVPTGYKLGNLDGVIMTTDESIYVSDWLSGELFKLQGKERKLVLSLKLGLADIGVNKQYLFTPMMMDNEVNAWKLSDF
ncbi:hypothetical protein [Moritella viscosa]|uniref:NHL repeat n=1 Tax=Moritella viscosa TaxID=80854 RepID=A0ABY1HH43_9GAMM|nr:hypothetical protein [Moritella viscosa]CED60390.1 putative exported protein [Moritella viscosa]SGY97882.1 NHL repeat [Moritella viscosa]SGZ04523.1 NHL repeat [Moritella viscosa]SGZ11638.1 NHL repeat [Moritella viscosa]SHO13579.1 NHL repeat [Moritella viscosa]